jgi:hypothetical protein
MPVAPLFSAFRPWGGIPPECHSSTVVKPWHSGCGVKKNDVDFPPMKKILIINIFGIGDVLFTTPLIRNLKEHFPSCFIGYVCGKRAYDVLKDNHSIDKLFI